MKEKELHNLQQAAEAIHSADALLIAAGAGMGVDSGLPDFRGDQGFWKAYPMVKQLGLSFSDMANPLWFEKDPQLAWAFYGHRLNLYRRTVPHAGFARLLAWAAAKPEGCFVYTSNVDGQFQKAGFHPDRIVECHGSIHHLQCLDRCTTAIWEADGESVQVDEPVFRAQKPLPQCRHCGGMARPNIMMFNDFSWLATRTRAQEAKFELWLKSLKSARLVVIELGAGTDIPTVRVISEMTARRLQGNLVRINPREPGVPAGQFGLAASALAGIEQLDAA